MNWLKKAIENTELFAAACLSNCSGSSTYLKCAPNTSRQAFLTPEFAYIARPSLCSTEFPQNFDSQQPGPHSLMGSVLWYIEPSTASKKQSKGRSLAIRPIAQPVSCPQIGALFPSQTREFPSKTHTGNGAWQGVHLPLCPVVSGRGMEARTGQHADHSARCQDVSLCFEFTQLTTNRGCDVPDLASLTLQISGYPSEAGVPAGQLTRSPPQECRRD